MEEQKYNKKFIKYDTPMKRSIEKAEIDEDEMSLDDDDDIDSISDDDSYTSMDESESEDEEDLLDKAALQRAKKLRELVRQKAADTKAIKDAKISKLLKHVMTELNEWNRINDEQAQLFRNQNGSKSDQGDQTKTFDDTYQRLEKMKTSLSKLTSTLKVVDVELPENMESLQQTSDTILHYIKKIENQKNKGGGLSRVEEAIYSRIGRKSKYSTGESSDGIDGFGSWTSKLSEMDAEQRFALFVSQVDSAWRE